MRPLIGNPKMRRLHVHRDVALLVVIVVALAVPFLSQPFHMDDNFYMDMARGARAHPLFPYDVPYSLGGVHVPDMASHSHPPLQAYFLAVMQHFVGEGEGKEWMYHSAALVFPLLAAISLYFLAALFVERPLWPALVLAVCPLVLVMEHNLMADLPTLAFWLAAAACFLWATELRRKSLYAASSLFQCAAMFASYQAVALAPLLGYYHLRKRGSAFAWIALALPLGGMCAWLGMTSVHYGRLVLLTTVGYVQSQNAASLSELGKKALTLLESQGWLTVFPVFLLYILARGLKGRLLGLSLLASVFLVQVAIPGYRVVDKAIFVCGLVTGMFITGHMLALFKDAFRKGQGEVLGFGRVEAQFIALWYCGVAAYCLILFIGGSARYILPLVPPILIYFFRCLEVREASEYRDDRSPLLNSAMVASGSLVLSLAWGLLLSQADFEFARVYPRAAAAVSRLSSGLDSYACGDWGFRYYLGTIGARPLPADETAVRGGSLLVKPRLANPYDAPIDLASMTIPFGQLAFDLRTPLRTMDWHSPAGFYSSGWGLIPFSFSAQSQEVLQIRQVSFMIERLPWAHVESSSGVMPWPGFAPAGERALAILARPGTRLIYPLSLPGPMTLSLRVGFLNETAPEDETAFEFAVLCNDGQGRALAQFDKTLVPARLKEDREWQSVRLLLPASGAGGETLEFRYSAHGPSVMTGAFSEAILTGAATENPGRTR